MPPAFNLSQDQTLRFEKRLSFPRRKGGDSAPSFRRPRIKKSAERSRREKLAKFDLKMIANALRALDFSDETPKIPAPAQVSRRVVKERSRRRESIIAPAGIGIIRARAAKSNIFLRFFSAAAPILRAVFHPARPCGAIGGRPARGRPARQSVRRRPILAGRRGFGGGRMKNDAPD